MKNETAQRTVYVRKPLRDVRVSQIQLDYQVTLILDDEDSTRIQIEGPILMKFGEGANAISVTPGNVPSYRPVVELLHKSVTEIVVFDDGALELSFDVSGTLKVSSGGGYEAWVMVGKKAGTLVSLPSGGVG